MYSNQFQLNEMTIPNLFKSLQSRSSQKNSVLAQFHQIKPFVWQSYYELMSISFQSHSNDATKYKQATSAIENLHISLVRQFEYLSSTLNEESERRYFLMQKLKTLYYYLLYVYTLRKVPLPGTWENIHETYSQLRRKGGKPGEYDFEHLYKKCLLQALYHPYNIPYKHYQVLSENSDKLATLIKIENVKSNLKDQFVVNAQKDIPFIDTAFEQITYDREYLAVNIKKLKRKMTVLTKLNYLNGFKKCLGLKPISKNIAQKFLSNISKSSIRIFERSECGTKCHCTISFSSTWHYLDSQNKQPIEPDMPGIIVNKSESGFCLEINQRPQKQFEQGQIIGVGENQQDQSFYVGLVRWITEISCNRILVGIEKIAINPFAVKCHLHGMNQKETLSLLFQGKKVCLLTPMYSFRPGLSLLSTQNTLTPEGFSLGKFQTVGHYKIFELD